MEQGRLTNFVAFVHQQRASHQACCSTCGAIGQIVVLGWSSRLRLGHLSLLVRSAAWSGARRINLSALHWRWGRSSRTVPRPLPSLCVHVVPARVVLRVLGDPARRKSLTGIRARWSWGWWRSRSLPLTVSISRVHVVVAAGAGIPLGDPALWKAGMRILRSIVGGAWRLR